MLAQLSAVICQKERMAKRFVNAKSKASECVREARPRVSEKREVITVAGFAMISVATLASL